MVPKRGNRLCATGGFRLCQDSMDVGSWHFCEVPAGSGHV
jgi:hypothetical protein